MTQAQVMTQRACMAGSAAAAGAAHTAEEGLAEQDRGRRDVHTEGQHSGRRLEEGNQPRHLPLASHHQIASHWSAMIAAGVAPTPTCRVTLQQYQHSPLCVGAVQRCPYNEAFAEQVDMPFCRGFSLAATWWRTSSGRRLTRSRCFQLDTLSFMFHLPKIRGSLICTHALCATQTPDCKLLHQDRSRATRSLHTVVACGRYWRRRRSSAQPPTWASCQPPTRPASTLPR